MLQLTPNPNQTLQLEIEKKTVLIVDDEAVIRDLCKRVLHDYDVIEAGDGAEALEIFLRGGIDVILTDVMMPEMDGLELLKNLKEREPTVVVIIMTGFAEKEVILNALKADADDFIPLLLEQVRAHRGIDTSAEPHHDALFAGHGAELSPPAAGPAGRGCIAPEPLLNAADTRRYIGHGWV